MSDNSATAAAPVVLFAHLIGSDCRMNISWFPNATYGKISAWMSVYILTLVYIDARKRSKLKVKMNALLHRSFSVGLLLLCYGRHY